MPRAPPPPRCALSMFSPSFLLALDPGHLPGVLVPRRLHAPLASGGPGTLRAPQAVWVTLGADEEPPRDGAGETRRARQERQEDGRHQAQPREGAGPALAQESSG